jgi:CubicO group peptidase (beta-lactamase class C family)
MACAVPRTGVLIARVSGQSLGTFFGRVLLGKGAIGEQRILARPTVESMTTDHLTPEQKALSPFFPSFWDARGWGLGLLIVPRRHELGRGPGSFGCDGAFGTSWYVDPSEDLVGVLMTQSRQASLQQPAVVHDFWTSAAHWIDD